MTYFWAIFFITLYFCPSIVSFHNHKRNAWVVLLANIFFGWTLIGWFILMFIAYSEKQQQTTIINNKRSHLEELEKLHELKEKGTLTEEEFIAQKKKIL